MNSWLRYHRFQSICWSCSYHLTATLILFYLVTNQANSDDSLEAPQLVYVSTPKAQLQSGPTEEYYPTALLKRGTQLEVYQRAPGGWLGVLPPEGSFSWVQATDGYLLPGGKVVEITDADAVSWIGTQLGTAKQYRWQVQLDVGDQLAILAESTMKDRNGEEALWYKIAPPDNELRWIHESVVTTSKPTSNADQKEDDLHDNGVIVASYHDQTMEPSSESNSELGTSILDENAPPQTDVMPAQFEEDVFAEDITYSAEAATAPIHHPQPASGTGTASFDNWHAMEFGDDGLRLPFLERMIGVQRTDPLKYDPFSLEMPRKQPRVSDRIPAGVTPRRTGIEHDPAMHHYQPRSTLGSSQAGRTRGWRDPRMLGQTQPSMGNTSSSMQSPVRDYSARLDQTPPPAESQYNRPYPLEATVGMAKGLRQGFQEFRQSMQRRGRDSQNSSESTSEAPAGEPEWDTFASSDQSLRGAEPNGGTSRFIPPSDALEIDWYGVKQSRQNSHNALDTRVSSLSPSPQPSSTSNSELGQLQVELTEMVSRPPGLWNLDPIVERTQKIIDQGVSPVERGQARLLMDRIKEFQQHARRSAFVPGANFQAGYRPSDPSGTSPVQTASFNRPVGSPVPATTPQGAQRLDGFSADGQNHPAYDATGWLVPVYSSTENQPTHALADESGTIITYLTALPGLNLSPYVNQPVGVLGLRGYLPQLRAAHIQANRIVRLK